MWSDRPRRICWSSRVKRLGPARDRLVGDLEDADELGPVHDGHAEQVPRRGLEEGRVALAQAPVEGQVGDVDVVAEAGDRGGEVLGLERGDVFREIRMRQEGVVPDEGLQVAADDLVLLHDVDRDAPGLDDVADLGDDVEEAADVVGPVDPAEDRLDPLALLLRPDVARFDGQALFDLAEEARVEQALDLADLVEDVLDLGLLEAEGAPQDGRLLLEPGALDDAPERPEERQLPGLGGGGAAEVGVDGLRPFVGRAGDQVLVLADDEDPGRRADHGLEGVRAGEGRVDDDGRDVAPGQGGERLFGIGFAPDRPVLPGQAGQTVGLRRRRVHDEDARLDHSPLGDQTARSATNSSFSLHYVHQIFVPGSIDFFGFDQPSRGCGIFPAQNSLEVTNNGENSQRSGPEYPGAAEARG